MTAQQGFQGVKRIIKTSKAFEEAFVSILKNDPQIGIEEALLLVVSRDSDLAIDALDIVSCLPLLRTAKAA